MNSARIAVCLAAFSAAALVASAQRPLAIKLWEALSDRDLTPLGRAVWMTGKPDWVHAESEHFVFHAATPAVIEEVAAEAETARAKIDVYFGTNCVSRKGHVFVVGQRRIWEKVLGGTDRKDDSLAMQMENDLFILKESNSVVNVLRLPHEMVHFRLWQLYGHRVPVWLDEGLAATIGWKVAVDVHRSSKGKQLVRAPPFLPRERLMSMEELTSMIAYPAGNEAAPAFYIETELLVTAIARKIGDDKLAEFVKAVAGDGVPWTEYLRKRFGFADSDFDWLAQQIEKNASP